jgi:hypothetical protein
MAELAAVIAEYTLDNNAENWFRMPWRDGWNAVELAVSAIVDVTPDWWLIEKCEKRIIGSDTYEVAQEFMGLTPSRMTRAALRCLQVLVAKSDGGGEIYNAILLRPFAAVYPESVADFVLEYRCRDSIGTTSELKGDANDRLRRAFATAWRRGLYLASYSLPPATTRQLKVIK